MNTALEAIIQDKLWQADRPFETFGDFAVALPPIGLGVRSLQPSRILRHALLSAGYFSQWTEILERTVRQRGRPRNKLANDEDCRSQTPWRPFGQPVWNSTIAAPLSGKVQPCIRVSPGLPDDLRVASNTIALFTIDSVPR